MPHGSARLETPHKGSSKGERMNYEFPHDQRELHWQHDHSDTDHDTEPGHQRVVVRCESGVGSCPEGDNTPEHQRSLQNVSMTSNNDTVRQNNKVFNVRRATSKITHEQRQTLSKDIQILTLNV